MTDSVDTGTELVIDGITHGGEGVGRADGKAVFVAGALPGERVRVTLVEQKKRWARATLLEVLVAAPERVEPPCQYVSECGGCDMQHASVAAQLALKSRIVREQLERIGKVANAAELVAECLPVGPATGYRNTTRMHADADGRLGFHRGGTHEVVPIDRCLLLSDDVHDIRLAVGDGTGAEEVAMRSLGSDGHAVLQAGPEALDLPAGPANLGLRQPNGSVATMRGSDELSVDVGGITYGLDSSCFFQVNLGGAEVLVKAVLAAVDPQQGQNIWDLYSGVGLFSVPLALEGAAVTAVEGHKAAAGWATKNAAVAGIGITSIASPVDRFVQTQLRDLKAERPTTIVLDPPRTGAGEKLVTSLSKLGAQRLVYVACDVAALARDTRALAENGYILVSAQPFDLFPMTHHIEVVATFARQNN